ncbi:MAG: SoxR reducing system RseC family protein [Pseudomonadales bacterium]|nr:SoxR reducing system RseC family protein [Pseudomonadales bacterium]
MFKVHGRVTAAEAGDCRVIFAPPSDCGGCDGCRVRERQIRIPGRWEEQTELTFSMSTRDGVRLLTQSLVLPLIGFVLGAVVANSLQLSELLVIGGALAGLVTGIVSCRTQTFNSIYIDRG